MVLASAEILQLHNAKESGKIVRIKNDKSHQLLCSLVLENTNFNPDQGLHCLLTGISIRNRIKMKNTPYTPKIGN